MKIVLINASNRLPVRTLQVIDTFKKRGHCVTVINWKRSNKFHDNFHGLVDDSQSIQTANIALFLARSFSCLLKQPSDCFMTDDIRFLPLILLAAKLKKKKTLYNYREYPAATFAQRLGWIPLAKPETLIRIFENYEDFFLQKTGGIICIPIDFKKNNAIATHANCRTVCNFPSLYDKPLDKDVEFYQKQYGNKRLLVFCGNISNDKGMDKYISLARKLNKTVPDSKLVVVGDGNDRIADEILSGTNIDFLPHVPYTKLLGLLSIARVGLAMYDPANVKFRRLKNGVSRKIFTYMACGLPVVASKMDMNIVVEQAKCGMLVDFDNCDQLYNACLTIISDDRLQKKFGGNARLAVEQKYNWQIQEQDIEHVLESA